MHAQVNVNPQTIEMTSSAKPKRLNHFQNTRYTLCSGCVHTSLLEIILLLWNGIFGARVTYENTILRLLIAKCMKLFNFTSKNEIAVQRNHFDDDDHHL